MSRPAIKIAFVDFWDNFVPEQSRIWQILSRHYDPVLSPDPVFLFYSSFGELHLGYDCVRIFMTGENQAPDFNICDYATGFEFMEFGDRYLRFPNGYNYITDWEAMETKHKLPEEAWNKRKKFCAFVISNPNSAPERELVIEKLSRLGSIDSGGRWRNNVGGPVSDKGAFLGDYRFSLALENVSHPGYTTEKLVQAFAAGTIPIYWGDPLVGRVFNTEAFVNCSDYPSLDGMVDAVERLMDDPQAMEKMMRTPALRDEKDSLENMTAGLEAFLCHIIDQGPEAAKRCSRLYWGKRYLERARMFEKAYSRSFRGLAEALYKKTLWRWRTKSGFAAKIDRMFKKNSA